MAEKFEENDNEMGAEKFEGKSTEEKPLEEAEGPANRFQPFVRMEELLEKLKLLNYEQGFIRKNRSYKPIPRHYFAIASNPGEQFFMFTSIAAWLIMESGKMSFEIPQENDDPNATISKILNELRTTLKSGAGQQCIYVLNKLANAALKETQFSWRKFDGKRKGKCISQGNPEINAFIVCRACPIADEDDEVGGGADEAELTAEQFEELEEEEEDPQMADDEDESGFLDLHIVETGIGAKQSEGEMKKKILQSDTDAIAWKLEVERVMPSLKIVIRSDEKDWRMHLEQMQTYRTTIGEIMEKIQPQLERFSNKIEKNLEKISSREKYLNGQLESLLSEYRASQDKAAETREKYRDASRGVTERSKTLAGINEKLEQVKQDMEERGTSLTDGAPMLKIKQAVSKLKQELIVMDIQIGVIEQTLLQSQLRDRNLLSHGLYSDAIY